MKTLFIFFLLFSPFFSHSKARKSSIDRADAEREECAYTSQGDRYNPKWRKLMDSLLASPSDSDQEEDKPGTSSGSE